MYLVLIGWLYVAMMMAVAEATSTTGTLLGTLVTFVLYGVLPLAIVMYLLLTPARRRARLAAQNAVRESATMPNPAQRHHAARDAVAPERKEP